MTQSQLDRAVASATGESRRTIGRLGFSLLEPLPTDVVREAPDVARFLDWDQLAQGRFARAGVH